MKKVDFGQVAESYARSRSDIPNSFFESLQFRNLSFEGKKVADIACGTGVLTRKLKYRKADVVGIDPSQELIAEARKINKLKYVDIPYELGTAEQTNLPSGEYDMVTVLRAWHWFNRQESIGEVKRILRNKGALIVADSGFVPSHEVVALTFDILQKHLKNSLKPAGSKADSKQRINGFPVEWFEEWTTSGFELRDFYKLDYEVQFTNEEWVDRVASLSYLAGESEDDRKMILNELLTKLSSRFHSSEHHTIAHACYICILKLNKND